MVNGESRAASTKENAEVSILRLRDITNLVHVDDVASAHIYLLEHPNAKGRIIKRKSTDVDVVLPINEGTDKERKAKETQKEISDVLARYNLNIENMRGQGYNGASNMRGLELVAAAQNDISVWLFFSKLASIVNLVSASPKRQNELHCAQAAEVEHMLATGERETGRGANQIGTLHRAGTTRWSFHFSSICSLIDMYSATIKVLQTMVEEGSSNSIRGEAGGVLIAVLVETNKSQHYHLIDLLIRLVLTLLVTTTTTERAFSAMKHVKTVLRNMEDEFLADSMVIYIERDFSKMIDSDSIIDDFYSMKSRRAQLQ
ncbi:uncharacterized protein LOC130784923 [Actinidia eriantha]|uniref:uncharacterized protein LOC130784923 n=1 Tax=Actinidia eriantha TaxID=165200 RepID=UPI002587B87B|nr:uncharacterized protein LOC130784923 [Actinidia eriantha]